MKQNWKPSNLLNPVPVVMISTQRPGEKPNIITVAWAGTICSDPVMVSISVRPERHSHAILEETGEFVINLVNEELTFATDYCGVRSGKDVDKFAEMKLTPEASEVVKCPCIAESPVCLECVVREVKRLGSHDMYLAEVVNVKVDEKYLDENGRLDMESAKLVSYSHGEYFALGEKLGKFGYSVRKN